MRILVTGHRGHVGAPVARHLAGLGHEVVGFDRADGVDLLDLPQVRRATAGCAAVVHLGALAHDTAGSPEQIMAVNVLGTWHVLLAAEAAGVMRVVHFSSAQVFGIAAGERLPDYFPVDDAHPRRAMRAYGLSKCLAEDLCAGFTARSGIASVSLRPVWVWDPSQYQRIETRWRCAPRSEWEPFWEYGAFVDVRDVTTAVEQALAVPLAGHHRALLCAADIAATAPSLAVAARLAPGVPVTGPARYRADPWRALVDCSEAETTLGWRPSYSWSRRGSAESRLGVRQQASASARPWARRLLSWLWSRRSQQKAAGNVRPSPRLSPTSWICSPCTLAGALGQDSQMPLFAPPVADERDGLLSFLAQQRDSLCACVLGLTDEQARAAPSASELSLGGLVKHSARTERRWVIAGIAGRPLPGLWPIENWPDDFQMGRDETLTGLLGYYADTAAQTEQIIRDVADLGQPLAVDPEQSVRWVLLHLIKETARHAGHADIIRETLDGQRAGRLTDAYDAGRASSEL